MLKRNKTPTADRKPFSLPPREEAGPATSEEARTQEFLETTRAGAEITGHLGQLPELEARINSLLGLENAGTHTHPAHSQAVGLETWQDYLETNRIRDKRQAKIDLQAIIDEASTRTIDQSMAYAEEIRLLFQGCRDELLKLPAKLMQRPDFRLGERVKIRRSSGEWEYWVVDGVLATGKLQVSEKLDGQNVRPVTIEELEEWNPPTSRRKIMLDKLIPQLAGRNRQL